MTYFRFLKRRQGYFGISFTLPLPSPPPSPHLILAKALLATQKEEGPREREVSWFLWR
jgi:hypothetical protein